MTDIFLSTFLLSLVLLGIHSYFGIEIIKRGIIFTDLAIGQMAAVGASVSLLFFEGQYLYLISLAFSIFAGALIAFASKKTRSHRIFYRYDVCFWNFCGFYDSFKITPWNRGLSKFDGK